MISRRTALASLLSLAARPAFAARWQDRLVTAAEAQVGVTLLYDPSYVRIAYPGGDKAGQLADIAGLAIWASVSEEVDAKIREQVQAGTFPIRLKAEDWNSGDINWLLDVIAPDQRTTANVIANFKQVVKEGSLRLHPIVTRLVDAETLQKMGAEKMGAPASAEREEATVN